MIITKKEAKRLKLWQSKLCQFHQHNPDQEAVMYSCLECKLIQDPCGCGSDEGCELCDKRLIPKKRIIN